MSDIARWLDDRGFGHLKELFERQRVDSSLLPELTDQDLRDIGVTALGDRKRLLKAIKGVGAAHLAASPAPDDARAADRSSASIAASSVAASAEAARPLERRQLTVMFCDLVGSTELAARLDPEDFQERLRTYHDVVARTVSSQGGYVAQLLGDGALVYFGYPRANEDDAVRAVRAGLELIETVRTLAVPQGIAPAAPQRITLDARVGIATGPVVVGDVGVGTPAAERIASGETPNLAARLQVLARAGDVVIAEQTRRLLGAAFELASLGRLQPKGLLEPVEVWRVVAEKSVETRFDALRSRPAKLFVGREAERAMLVERWERSRSGESQVVLISGEAGIGKSRICRSLREGLPGERVLTLVLQCSPDHAGVSLYPFVHALERLAGIGHRDAPEARRSKLDAWLDRVGFGATNEHAVRLAGLVGSRAGGSSAAGTESPQLTKARTLVAIAELIGFQADAQPLLVVIEDVHWIDPTSEELLGVLLERLRRTRALVLMTCRPEYQRTWGDPVNLTQLALGRLSQQQSGVLAAAIVEGYVLPAGVVREIVLKTDGIPLFVEEVTRSVIESGHLRAAEFGDRPDELARILEIPSTLQDSLMARLDRVGSAKDVAQVAAVIGRDFSAAVVEMVLEVGPAQLRQAFDVLEHAGLIARRHSGDDSTLSFRHALIRDTAYLSLGRVKRLSIHRKVAEAIAQSLGELAAEHQEVIGDHYFNAECWQEASDCLSRAAQRSAAKAAFAESASSLQRALDAVARMPADEAGRRRELKLLFRLHDALLPICRYARLREVLERAESIASELGDTAAVARLGSCQAHFHWIARGEDSRAAEHAYRSLAAGPDEGRTEREVPTRFYLGQIEHSLGRLQESVDAFGAIERLVRSTSRWSRFEQFFSVIGHGWASQPLCDLGRFEQAQGYCDLAFQTAHESGDSLLLVPAYLGAIYLHLSLGDHASAGELGEQALDLLRTMGDLPQWFIPVAGHAGAAVARRGDTARGVEILEASWDVHRATGLVGQEGWYAALLGEAYLLHGLKERAGALIAESMRISSERGNTGFRAMGLVLGAEALAAEGAIGFDAAGERLTEALQASQAIGHRVLEARCRVDLEWIAQRSGSPQRSGAAREPRIGEQVTAVAGGHGEPFMVFSTLTRACVPAALHLS